MAPAIARQFKASEENNIPSDGARSVPQERYTDVIKRVQKSESFAGVTSEKTQSLPVVGIKADEPQLRVQTLLPTPLSF